MERGVTTAHSHQALGHPSSQQHPQLSSPVPASVPAPASPSLQSRTENYVGYLVSTFSDVTPAVQFHLSKGNDAGSYTFLNKGQPVLKSTVGTKGVRDIFLAHDGARTKYYMIATGKYSLLVEPVIVDVDRNRS